MSAPRALTYAHLGPLLRAYFESVWDEVLVPFGGATRSPDDRLSFTHAHVMDEYPCTEYRFQGHFGFGGKLRTRGNLSCRIDYYPEDKTETRELQQAVVNAKLAELWSQYFSKCPPDQH